MTEKKKEQLQAKAENEKRFMYCKKFLLEKRMTQRDVAKHLGVGDQVVSDFIYGRNNAKKVAQFFGLSEN